LKQLRARCEEIDGYITQNEEERDQLLETGAKLSIFVQQQVLLSTETSDNLGFYLRNECDAFKDAESETHRQNLEELYKRYEYHYEKANSSGEVFTMLDVHNMVNDLYKLPQNGETLKKAVLETEKSHKRVEQDDKSTTDVVIKKISKFFGFFSS